MDLARLSEARLCSILSDLYTRNCLNSDGLRQSVPGNERQAIEIACSLLSCHTRYTRDIVMVALTSCRQCFLSNAIANCIQLLELDILASVMRTLSISEDKFIVTGISDLVISIQSFLVIHVTGKMNQKRWHTKLMELLHMVYKQSLDSKQLSGIVACIQILSRSLSNLRKSERSAEVKEMLDMSVKIFNENWASARTIHNISGLVTADLLGCLSKVVKLSKYEDFKQYLSTCCSQLIEMAPISLGKNDRAMLWIWYLKSCKDILECPWDTNYTGDEELSFSHWMLSEVSTHALNNVPIPSQCNSGGEIATSEYDVVFLRSAVHSVILACVRLLAAVPTVPEAEQASLVNSVLSRLTELSEIVCRRLLSASGCGPISQWFFEVFLEQDDALCSCLLALQHIYAFLSSRPEVAAVDIKWLNSWDLFSSLVAHLSHDHNVLLDLMLSPETKFLEYFISVLHHIITNWQRIVLVSMLDGDLTEESESGISVSSQLVSLTNGFESLMTYTNDDDSLDNEADVDSFASDESCAGSEPSLNSVLAVLDKVHQRLCLINKKDISPFNNTPLLALLSQIKTLSSQYTVTSFS